MALIPSLPQQVQPPPFKTDYFVTDKNGRKVIAEEWRRFFLTAQTALDGLLDFTRRLGGGSSLVPAEDAEGPDPLPLVIIPTPPTLPTLPPNPVIPWFSELADEGEPNIILPVAPPPGQTVITTVGNITDLNIGTVGLVLMNNSTLATIQGIEAGYPGQMVMFISIGTGPVDFTHQDAGEGTAANRLINTVSSIHTSLAPGSGRAMYMYDQSTARWRLVLHEQGDFLAYSATWFASGTQPAIGNGTFTSEYYLRGRELLTLVTILMGTTTTFGTGFWQITLPTSELGLTADFVGLALDSDGSNFALSVNYSPAVNTGVAAINITTQAFVDAATPFAWASGDTFRFHHEMRIS